FLAAVAQRTQRLRFGPLVWPMPLHHPLRLIEEICMLDQLSGGRLELGFGRGAAPLELEYYGTHPQEAQESYAETIARVIKGLTPEGPRLKGRGFSLRGIPRGPGAAAEPASADLVRRARARQRRARRAARPQRR